MPFAFGIIVGVIFVLVFFLYPWAAYKVGDRVWFTSNESVAIPAVIEDVTDRGYVVRLQGHIGEKHRTVSRWTADVILSKRATTPSI